MIRTQNQVVTAKKKVKGTIHWVNAKHCKEVEVRFINNLISEESAESVEGQENAPTNTDYNFNPDSLVIPKGLC